MDMVRATSVPCESKPKRCTLWGLFHPVRITAITRNRISNGLSLSRHAQELIPNCPGRSAQLEKGLECVSNKRLDATPFLGPWEIGAIFPASRSGLCQLRRGFLCCQPGLFCPLSDQDATTHCVRPSVYGYQKRFVEFKNPRLRATIWSRCCCRTAETSVIKTGKISE